MGRHNQGADIRAELLSLENAAKHYDEDPLTALVSLIALINTHNRVNVIVQQPAGDHQPRQFG